LKKIGSKKKKIFPPMIPLGALFLKLFVFKTLSQNPLGAKKERKYSPKIKNQLGQHLMLMKLFGLPPN